jgi:hypothetical protein
MSLLHRALKLKVVRPTTHEHLPCCCLFVPGSARALHLNERMQAFGKLFHEHLHTNLESTLVLLIMCFELRVLLVVFKSPVWSGLFALFGCNRTWTGLWVTGICHNHNCNRSRPATAVAFSGCNWLQPVHHAVGCSPNCSSVGTYPLLFLMCVHSADKRKIIRRS